MKKYARLPVFACLLFVVVATQGCAWFYRQTHPFTRRRIGLGGGAGASFGSGPATTPVPLFLVTAAWRRGRWMFEGGMRAMFSVPAPIPGTTDGGIGLYRVLGDLNICRFWGVFFGCGGLSAGQVTVIQSDPASFYPSEPDFLVRGRMGLQVPVGPPDLSGEPGTGSIMYFILGVEGVVHLAQPQLLTEGGREIWRQGWVSGGPYAAIRIEISP